MITVPVCEEGDVRLVPVGNVNGTGRVEMCLDREWRIVGDETWGVEEAIVVCRQLGLPTDGQEYSIHKYFKSILPMIDICYSKCTQSCKTNRTYYATDLATWLLFVHYTYYSY